MDWVLYFNLNYELRAIIGPICFEMGKGPTRSGAAQKKCLNFSCFVVVSYDLCPKFIPNGEILLRENYFAAYIR